MNDVEPLSGAELRDSVVGVAGALTVDVAGALATRISDPNGVDRPAVAGDGLAATIVDAVLSRDPSCFVPSTGELVITSPSDAGARGLFPDTVAPGERERALAVDMTNWSVVVDGTAIVKVASSWGGADRAARQLARLGADSRAGHGGRAEITPPFLGSLDWHHPELGKSTIALVSGLIEGADDGWTWAVDDVLTFVAGGIEPGWPTALGELTATLHATLLPFADQLAPRPTGASMRARANDALDEALRVTQGDPGDRLRARASALRTAISGIPDDPRGGVFDLHGDLHVGQILRCEPINGASGEQRYWLIDFDGDPQLSVSERDQPDFSARDLAHLLSSIDLVGAVAMKRLGEPNDEVLRWMKRANRQLLDTYRDALAARSLDGATGSSNDGRTLAESFDERLLAGFIAEQLVRELLYADRFLPRWQYAADAAISFRYSSTSSITGNTDITGITAQEKPWTPPAFTTT